ncbi:glycosyltransferase family 4 protein [Thermodesulfobacteriota bacterium]
MNVAIDASCLLINPYSGLSEVVNNLLLQLPQIDDTVDISVFLNYFRTPASKRNIAYQGARNRIFKFPRRLMSLWWDFTWPSIDFCLKGVDIYHSLHIRVPPAKKIKTVLTVHDCRYLAFPELYSSRAVQIYRRQMETSLSRADQVVTVSEFTRQEVIRFFSFPKDRISTIYNGFSPYDIEKECNIKKFDRFFEENKLPRVYLLYTGVLDPRKNLARLIEAFALAKRDGDKFPDLIIAGIPQQEWKDSILAARARQLCVLENIHVCGIVKKEILVGLIREAHALCYPSQYEGFGFPPLEAMSLGVPVLAGNSSAIPEIAGPAACLIDPLSVDEIAKGLMKIVYDSDYRQHLTDLGYHQADKYSWRKAAAEYIDIYKMLIP